jgi:hypothetical protein
LADEIFDVIGSPKIVLPATAERGARLEALCHVAAWLIASSPQDDRQRFGTPSEEGSGKKSPTRVRSNAP